MTCIDSAYAGNSTYTTACAETIQYFVYTIYSLNIRMKKFDAKKDIFWENNSFVKFAIFSCLLLNKDFACAYIGKSTCTRAFTEAFWYFALDIHVLSMCMKKCHAKKYFLVKWLLLKFNHFDISFHYCAEGIW